MEDEAKHAHVDPDENRKTSGVVRAFWSPDIEEQTVLAHIGSKLTDRLGASVAERSCILNALSRDGDRNGSLESQWPDWRLSERDAEPPLSTVACDRSLESSRSSVDDEIALREGAKRSRSQDEDVCDEAPHGSNHSWRA